MSTESVNLAADRSSANGEDRSIPELVAPFDQLRLRPESPSFSRGCFQGPVPGPLGSPRRRGDQQPLVEDDLDRELNGLMSSVKKYCGYAVAVVGFVCACFVAIVAMLTVTYHWGIQFGAWLGRSLAGDTGLMGKLVDGVSYATDRDEKIYTLRHMLLEVWADHLGSIELPAWLFIMDKWDLAIALAVVLSATVGIHVFAKRLKRVGVSTIRYVRGVRFEAVIAGSCFVEGSMPPSQVEVMIPGILSDTHQGYGLRAGVYLVVPYHVVAGHSELILSCGKGKVMIPAVSVVKSRWDPDLAYVFVGDNIFSRIGATSLRAAKAWPGTVHASCNGKAGTSSGRLTKSPVRGKLLYEGSTLAGYSGAAYHFGGMIYGMHQGNASVSTNMGWSIEGIMIELKHMLNLGQQPTTTEAVAGTSPGAGEDGSRRIRQTFQNSGWGVRDLDSFIEDRYSREVDSWTEFKETDDFYDQVLDFGPESREPAKKESVKVLDLEGSVQRIRLQNSTGADLVQSVIPADLVDYLQALHSGRVLERLSGLEEYTDSIRYMVEKRLNAPAEQNREEKKSAEVQTDAPAQKPAAASSPPPPERFPCDHCPQVCRTRDRLLNHIACSHTVVHESAVAEDTGASGKIVKMAKKPFLEKPASGQKKKKPSSKNLSPSVSQRQSLSTEECLSQMLASQRNLEKVCSGLLAALAGRASATTQK